MRWMIVTMLGCRLSLAALAVGTEAPNFALSATDGKDYDLKTELKVADGAIVVFLASKCPYSNSYNERLNDLTLALKKLPKKIAFFAINASKPERMDDVKKHAAKEMLNFPVLKDADLKVVDGFGAERTPEAFLLDKQGKVVYHGRIDDDSEGKNVKRRDLLVATQELVNTGSVKITETRAFGCSIKRK